MYFDLMIRVKGPARRSDNRHRCPGGSLPSSCSARPRSAPTRIPARPGVDALHYVFRLGLSDRSSEITGETTMTVKFLRDGVADLNLDLTSLVGRKRHDRAVGAARRADRDARAGLGQPHVHARRQPPAHGPAAAIEGRDRNSRFTIRYRGTPAAGLRIGDNMHGERTFFSENWPNHVRQWLPMIDHPYDKATGEFIVTAPSHYQVVANGLLIEELDLPSNLRRTHWKQSVPIASWLYTLGVARFSSHHAGVVDGVPVQTWVFPQDRDAGLSGCSRTSRGARCSSSSRTSARIRTRSSPTSQATGFTGGTEYASAIFYGEKGVSSGRGPVVHEIAHQWFGNSVTERDWDDVWLSEGFATYFTLLFTEHDEGRDAFVDGLKRSRAQVLQLEQKLPDTPVIHRNLADMSEGAEQPGLPEGRLGAAHAAAGSRHRAVLDGDPRVLPPLSQRQRVDRRSARGVRAGVGQAARLVLHAVAESPGRAEDRGLVALRRGEEGTSRSRSAQIAGAAAVSREASTSASSRRPASCRASRPSRIAGQAGHVHISARRCTCIGGSRPEHHPADGRRAVRQALESDIIGVMSLSLIVTRRAHYHHYHYLLPLQLRGAPRMM